MTLFCPSEKGETLLLQYIVGMVNADNPVLHLFGNDITPSHSTQKADVHEVGLTVAGYAPMTLGHTAWTTKQDAGGVTTAVHSEVTFSFGTSVSIYGYYVTNASNDILWLERFSGVTPFSIPDSGGTISITAQLTLS